MVMNKKFYDIIIIGGGTAGMTAAVYARRAGKSVLLLESELFGGQIAYSPCVENFPAMSAVSGTEFSDRLLEQVQTLGADIELECVTEIKDGDKKTVITDYGEYECTAIIAAVGLTHRKTELENEENLIGSGVSYCAVCDGAFFKDKNVLVYGGGNTALQDAIFLADICKNVSIIHRRDKFRGDQKLVSKLEERDNVHFLLENIITAINGNISLESVTLKNTKTGEESTVLTDGLFIAIGQIPRSDVLKSVITLDEWGFVVAGEDCLTDKEGIFVAGDCRTKEVRQLTTAAADGAVAATAACSYIDMKR